MRIDKNIFWVFMLLFMNYTQAQTEETKTATAEDSVKTLSVDPFDHQDGLGQSIYIFFLNFEKTGHFADQGHTHTNQKILAKHIALFDSAAFVPNDLNMKDTVVGPAVSIHEYGKLAKKNGFFPYRLILEKRVINATEVDSGRYQGYYRYFKLFSQKAVLGEAYNHGATYKIVFEFNKDGSDIRINNITQEPNGEYRNFRLGNFGYTSDFNLMATYNLKNLKQEPTLAQIEQLKPPKDSADYRAQPAFALQGSYVLPSYLWAANYAGNLNATAGASTKQSGWGAGLRLQLPMGQKGNFNLTFGLEYEVNNYEVQYNDLQFIYKTDCFGKPLKDLEDSSYDEKWVDVSSNFEKGSFSFIKPEIGLLYKIKMGKKLELDLLAAAGFSYLTSSEFTSETTVSYRGKKYGFGDPISQDELGFYTDYKKNSSGEISNASSFYYYKFGGSLDFALSQTSTLSFGFEMRNGLSPIFETGYEFWPFLDPELNDTFLSSFTNVQESVTYQSMAFVFSYKFQFKKK